MRKGEYKLPLPNRHCYDCDSEMTARLENYKYCECGLDNVVLMQIPVYRCHCGAIEPEIPALSGLHLAIAETLMKKPSLLTAQEIRFLRKTLGMSATEMAGTMGVTKQTMSRWETGDKEIGITNDRMLRLFCFTNVLQRLVREKRIKVDLAKLKRENLSD